MKLHLFWFAVVILNNLIESVPDAHIDIDHHNKNEQVRNINSIKEIDVKSKEKVWTFRRWADGIVPYEISDNFTLGQIEAIKDAIQAIEDVSCVRFIRKSLDTKDYISVIPSETDCNSKIGRVGDQQFIKLKPAKPGIGCMKRFKIVHELMHALGFYHQHQHPDRDLHIKILYENIHEDAYNYFKIRPESMNSNFGLPYDYESVMHYGHNLFPKDKDNRLNTIEPLNPNANIGQREKFSDLDIKKLNLFYNCNLNKDFESVIKDSL